jgi:integrase
MAIFQKGKNWYIDYYLRGRRKRKKIGPSKKLAGQVLKDVLTKIVKKEYLGILEENKILFEDYAKEYLEYSKANKSVSTYERRDRFSTNNLISTFKGKRFFEITPEMIEKYKAARLEKVEPATVIEWGYVRTNPGKGIKRLKEPPGRLRYLKPEQVETLLKCSSKHIRPIVVTALNTGMRSSEIFNLKWPQVDLENRKITVINAKNNESRVIPIDKTLYKELFNLSQKSKGEYVFPGQDGHPLRSIRKAFSSALKKAGIEDFTFHDLRHTFASHLVMKRTDIRTVQQLMGHKDIKMTMRYSHLSPEYVQEAVEGLDDIWTPFGHQS